MLTALTIKPQFIEQFHLQAIVDIVVCYYEYCHYVHEYLWGWELN